MNQNEKEYVMEKVKELINAHSCCPEAREAAKAWLDAVDTDREAEQGRILIAELEEDLVPVEQLIAFAKSEAGAKVFGDKAGEVAAHAMEIQAAGGKYCDCPACAAVEAILEKKELLL